MTKATKLNSWRKFPAIQYFVLLKKKIQILYCMKKFFDALEFQCHFVLRPSTSFKSKVRNCVTLQCSWKLFSCGLYTGLSEVFFLLFFFCSRRPRFFKKFPQLFLARCITWIFFFFFFFLLLFFCTPYTCLHKHKPSPPSLMLTNLQVPDYFLLQVLFLVQVSVTGDRRRIKEGGFFFSLLFTDDDHVPAEISYRSKKKNSSSALLNGSFNLALSDFG